MNKQFDSHVVSGKCTSSNPKTFGYASASRYSSNATLETFLLVFEGKENCGHSVFEAMQEHGREW